MASWMARVQRRVGVKHLAQHGDRDLSVDCDRERTEHFTVGRPGVGGSDQYPGVGDKLDEPVVAQAVDPAPGGGRDRETAVCTVTSLPRAWASVRPTAPTSGSVKVTRGSARYLAGWCAWPRMSLAAMPA